MPLIPSVVEQPFSRALDPWVKIIARSGVTPNTVSTIGFVSNVVAALLLFAGQFVLAGVFVLCAGVCDMIDGKLARLTKKNTVYGAVYDATMDRAGELAIYTGIGAYLIEHNMHISALIAVLAVGGSVLISYVRARAESYQVQCTVGILRRGDRIFLFGIGALLSFLDGFFREPIQQVVFWFDAPINVPPMPLTLMLYAIALLAPVTVAQRLRYIKAIGSSPD